MRIEDGGWRVEDGKGINAILCPQPSILHPPSSDYFSAFLNRR
jgi:hypothetical protein